MYLVAYVLCYFIVLFIGLLCIMFMYRTVKKLAVKKLWQVLQITAFHQVFCQFSQFP